MLRLHLLMAILSTQLASAADPIWPQFRGPSGLATSSSTNLPDEWSSEKNLAWKVKLHGSGWAQPIVIGNQVFISTAVSDPPIVPKNMMAGVMDPKSIPSPTKKGPTPGPDVKIDWQLLCLDLKTGKTDWARTITSGKPKYAIHPSNTYATETPATDGKCVFVFYGATGTVAAYDLAGKQVWKVELGAYPGTADLGVGASPAIYEGLLYVPLLNEAKASIVALDTITGQEKFTISRDKPGTSWSSPFIWKNSVRTELVICGKGEVSGHNPINGKKFWSLGGIDSSFSSTPAATADVIIFGNGGPGSKSPLFGIKAGAKGDITLKDKETSNEGVLFYKVGAAPGMASPIAVGDLVYVLNNGGLACIEPKTGQQLYKERLPKARTVAASPFSAAGKIYFLDESGLGVVVKAGKEFEVVGSSKLDDTFWSSPTPAGNYLLLRGVNYLYCLKK